MHTLYTRVRLFQLKCIDKPDGWTSGEPYLWNIFFKIDGSCIRVNEQFRLEGKPTYHFSKGSQGNLNAKDIAGGDTIGIPADVGEWKTSLVPLKIPYFESSISGVIGVVCVLMEQNLVSGTGAEAGHEALNKHVANAIDLTIAGFDPRRVDLNDVDRSVKHYFDAQVKQYTEKIGPLVGQAVSSAQSVVQNIFSLVKKDVLIGYHVWDFSNAGIDRLGGELTFSHRFETKKYGDWEVRGRLSARNDPDEINAVKRKRSKEEEEE
jgi:hypothetical protein